LTGKAKIGTGGETCSQACPSTFWETQVASLTDPARKLADVCITLDSLTEERGDLFIARMLYVNAWSSEFYQVISVIIQRSDNLIKIVGNLEMDSDIREETIKHISQVKRAFSAEGLQNPWSHSVKNFICSSNIGPIKMLSPQVRTISSYPKLDQSEIDELSEQIEELISWLTEHQLRDRDFIRQAIIEGLHQLQFRLQRIGWLGWGYTLRSLREVIAAYMALERGTPDLTAAPDADAVLRKLGSFVKQVYEKATIIKDIAETGDFFLKAYGATTLLVQGRQTIAGLLTLASG
jgi:hypothetical protein